MIQKPAITSLASAKGPSVMTGLPPDTRRRVPLEVGWRPSAASSTPALAMSWLNFLIGRTMSGLGTANFSRACAGAGNSIMNRIVVSPSDSAGDRGFLPASAETGLHLHVERGETKSTGTVAILAEFVKGSRNRDAAR